MEWEGRCRAGTYTGAPVLSGDYNTGYRTAIQDIIEIFTYIQPDLREHRKCLNGKTSVALLKSCLENRAAIRDQTPGFIRWNGQKKDFEWFVNEECL